MRDARRTLPPLALAGCLVLAAACGPSAEERTVRDTVVRLITTLGKGDETSDRAVAALVALGPQAVGSLTDAVPAARDDAEKDVVRALDEIGKSGAVDVVPALLTVLSRARSWEARQAAIEALGARKDRRAVAPLTAQYARDADPQVRYECLTSLGLIGDPAARNLLLRETRADDQYVRMWAMDALCTMRDPEAAGRALALLGDPSRWVRAQVLRSCGGLLDDPDGRRRLVAVAVSPEGVDDAAEARRQLGLLLVRSRDGATLREEARATARAALAGPQRKWAALLLGDLRDPAAVEALVETLRDPDARVRHAAAYALGQLRDPRAVPPLIAALADDQALVAATAHAALRWFAEDGDGRARDALAHYRGAAFQPPLEP